MFKYNEDHRQTDMFGFTSSLSPAKQQKLQETKEQAFYELIYCKIDESPFVKLYSDKTSRPNAPVNTMVASLLLKEHNGWSYEELFSQIDFDLRTRIALGLSNLNETPFCPATLFNFQNRLSAHYLEKGEDFLGQVFDCLTTEQLKTLKIKTNIQRAASFLASSNIRTYSRLQLLVEVLLRVHRILSDDDQQALSELFAPYINHTSGQYIYHLKHSDLSVHLEQLAQTYHSLHQRLTSNYGDTEIFKIFERVYTEHFTVVNDKIKVIPAQELASNILQSPDDADATYRKKRDQESRGQTIHVNETAHPDNPLNLITDVAVAPNNTDDSKILTTRLDKMVEKTPDLDELHTDGAYGNEDNDRKMEELGIRHIQTAIKGRTSAVSLTIEQTSEDTYQVTCPYQAAPSSSTPTRFKAVFEQSVCDQCPLASVCSTIQQKDGRVYYFNHDDYLRNRRHRQIESIPPERRKIRPNVEATVREFKRRMIDGKLKVRGAFKTVVFAVLNAISINFGRIFRFQRTQTAQSVCMQVSMA
jgi:hypothetical protein